MPSRLDPSSPRLLRTSRWLVLVGVVVASLVGAGQALAEDPAPADDSSAVDQYQESIPTSSGSTPSGGGGGQAQESVTPLSASVATQITSRGGSDAKLLRKISTSSRYGAPQKSRIDHGTATGAEPVAPLPDTEASAGATLSAAASAVTDGNESRLIVLLALTVLISVAALGAAGFKQKRQRA